MSEQITNRCSEGIQQIRDPRYASLWELCGPQNGLMLLSAAYVEVDPGATSPLHLHEKTEEIYLIVGGAGVMYLGDQVHAVSEGACIGIPPKTVHAIGNPGSQPLRMFVVTSPPYTEDDDIEVGV